MSGNCQLAEDAALRASASAADSADALGDDVTGDAPAGAVVGSVAAASVDALTAGLSGCSLMFEIVSRQRGLRRLIRCG